MGMPLLPEILVALTALAVLLLDLFAGRERRVVASVSLLGLVVALLATLQTYGMRESLYGGSFLVDGFSFFFKIIFLSVALLVVLASVTDRVREGADGEFLLLLLLATLGMMVVSSAGDLLTLFLGIEMASLSTYVLAGFRKDKVTSEAAMKYFVMGALSSAMILFGISLLYGVTGELNLLEIARVLPGALKVYPILPVAWLAMVLLIAGFGFKMAVVPFHMWAPDTYQGAPTTVTAFLAAGSKKMGFAAAFRIFPVALLALRLDWSLVFALLAVATMTLGNVVALSQTNIKRMLAYSSIGHAGYVLVGLAALSQLGLAAGLFHILTHAFMKGGAFLAVALLSYRAVGEEITDYIGLGKRAPLTAFALLLFLLSLIGIPPLAGFWSKFFLVASAVNAGGWMIWIAGILLLNSALSLFYYARIIKFMYIDRVETELIPIREPLPILLALFLAALAVVLIGVFPETFLTLAFEAASSLLR
jgi:NADH-quinone oxidoreductase subunit N